MGGEAKQAKRDAANERLRVGFLAVAGPQLLELRDLLVADAGADVRESVGHELSRMAETARSLELDPLAAAASVAADHVRGGGDPAVLRTVAGAIRKAAGRPLLGPVIVVGEGAVAERIAAQAECVVEPVRLVSSADALVNALHVELPASVVVPARALDAVARLVDDGLPVVVYGDPADWALRLAAVDAGARAFVPASFDLALALDVARRQVAASDDDGPPQVFVLAEAGAARDALVAGLEADGLATMASAAPAEIAPALDQVVPDVIVVGAHVGGRRAEGLVRAVRAHVDGGDVPIVVIEADPSAGAPWAAGADEVLAAGLPASEIVARVGRLVRRSVARPRDRDRVTRLPTRPAVLATLDRHLANARRRGGQVAFALFQLDGLEGVAARYGRAGRNAAQRALASQLEGGTRRIDVVGQLGPDVFVVGLPDCREPEARRRMGELVGRFARRARGDQRLKELAVAVGIADTDTTVDRVLLRAVRDLARARAAAEGR